MTCTSAQLSTVDAASRVFSATSMSIGADGFGLIAYVDQPQDSASSTSKVKVAHCLNATCNSSRVSDIQAIGLLEFDSPGRRVGIATGPEGRGVVSYVTADHRELRIATCMNADCSSTVQGVGITADLYYINANPSIVIGKDGLPLISYVTDNVAISVAHCEKVYCTVLTSALVQDADGNNIRSFDLSAGADGLAFVTYSAYDGGVSVSHCVDMACTAVTETTPYRSSGLPDVAATVGADGLPLIAFGKGSGAVYVLRCRDVSCSGPTLLGP